MCACTSVQTICRNQLILSVPRSEFRGPSAFRRVQHLEFRDFGFRERSAFRTMSVMACQSSAIRIWAAIRVWEVVMSSPESTCRHACRCNCSRSRTISPSRAPVAALPHRVGIPRSRNESRSHSRTAVTCMAVSRDPR